MKEINKVLSDNLFKLRRERGFRSQEDLAEAAGIPYRTYQDIERGLNWPQKQNLQAIASALGVEESRLLADSSLEPLPMDALKIIERVVKEHEEWSKIPRDILELLLQVKPGQWDDVRAILSPLVNPPAQDTTSGNRRKPSKLRHKGTD